MSDVLMTTEGMTLVGRFPDDLRPAAVNGLAVANLFLERFLRGELQDEVEFRRYYKAAVIGQAVLSQGIRWAQAMNSAQHIELRRLQYAARAALP